MTTSRSETGVRERSLLWHLIAFGAALTLPILIFLGVVLWKYAVSERGRIENAALTLARAMASDVNQEITGLAAPLQVLSTSQFLRQGDFGGFIAQLETASRTTGATAILRTRAGDIRAAPRTYHTARFQSLPSAATSVAADTPGLIAISNLFVDPATATPSFMMDLPVSASVETDLILTLIVPTTRLRGRMERTLVPPNWTSGIFDTNGLVLAGNLDNDDDVGKRGADDLIQSFALGEGLWAGRGMDGAPTFAAFTRSEATNWRVAIGVSKAELNAPLRQSLQIMGLTGASLCALALLAAWKIGGRMTSALGRLTASASMAEHGDSPTRLFTPITAINTVGRDLAQVSRSLRQRRDELAASKERLARILDTTPAGIIEVAADGTVTYANRMLQQLLHIDGDEILGKHYSDLLLSTADQQGAPLATGDLPMTRALAGAEKRPEVECNYRRSDGTFVWIKISSAPLRNEAGVIIGAIAAVADIDEIKQSQARQALMNRELHHRVKNTLATVQAIANLTARSTTDITAFRQTFADRIVSLSRTHTLLVENSWERIPLGDLVHLELDPYRVHGNEQVHLTGEDIWVRSDIGLALGMAVHELTTNAFKYGALSSLSGQLHVSWRIERDLGAQKFVLEWAESGGPVVAAPTRSGFGSQLLKNILARQLKGEVDVSYAPAGLRVRVKADM